MGVSWGTMRRPPTTWRRDTFRGSFEAGSTPIFASNIAFFSIFQNLRISVKFCNKFCRILQKFCGFLRILQNLPKNVKNFAKFCNFLAEICKICSREDDFLLDFEKCLKKCVFGREDRLRSSRENGLRSLKIAVFSDHNFRPDMNESLQSAL